MKKLKLALTVFAIVITVGSTLAVKANFFGSGSVYCDTNNSCTTRVSFRIDCNGTVTAPCLTGITPHLITGCSGGTPICTAIPSGTTFSATAAGK